MKGRMRGESTGFVWWWIYDENTGLVDLHVRYMTI